MDKEALTATKAGDILKIQQLLNSDGINVNAQDTSGRTLLHHAAYHGQHEVVKYLLRYSDADVLVSSEKNNTALHIAILRNNEAVVKAILENVSRGKLRELLDIRTRATGTTALHVAAMNDGHAHASFLMKYGANYEIANDAGERPVDLTRQHSELRKLFESIDRCFANAKNGKDQLLIDELDKCNAIDFIATVNCRDRHGRTIVQALVSSEYYELVNEVLWSRVNLRTNREHEPLHDLQLKDEVEKLARCAREFRDSWSDKRDALLRFVDWWYDKTTDNSKILTAIDAGKLGARALQQAHEVLLAHRKFEGKEKSLTVDPTMKTLEEVLEVLGFDTEQLHVDVDQESCYYEKLPAKWKDNVGSFAILMEGVIDGTIDFYLGYIYSIQIFAAVKGNDHDKVQQLIDRRVVNHGVDRNSRTPLCYAVENGNEKMVRLLLDNGATVVRKTALSPVYLAAEKGYAKIVKILLRCVDERDLATFIDQRHDLVDSTALHAAAKAGNLDIVKTLLRYGATYRIVDGKDRTPLDVSTCEEVSEFLQLVDECFHNAKEADEELVAKLETMPRDDFTAVIKAKNREGKTLADVAFNAKAKNVVAAIARIVEMTKK